MLSATRDVVRNRSTSPHGTAAESPIFHACRKDTAEFQRAVYNNRRRVRRNKGKQLQRLRSEHCERTFAHICDTGGMRRSWLRGLANVTKRYLIATAAHNLGRIMRKLFGVGKPKVLQGSGSLAAITQPAIGWSLTILAVVTQRFARLRVEYTAIRAG
jgi:hypothetical protein